MNLIIADIDGVFTDTAACPNSRAISLSAQLGSKCPFAFVTGRAARWLEKHLLSPLAEAYQNYRPSFSPLICAEYGGVIMQYMPESQWVRKSLFPISLEQHRKRIQAKMEGISGVLFDSEKEVMISVEADHSMEDTPSLIADGLAWAEAILKAEAASDPALEYQRTTYACDLVPKGLNKAYGARYIIDSLGFIPDQVDLIGDAPSDLLLADPLIEKNIPYLMHYVGEEKKLAHTELDRYAIHFSSAKYDKGTIEIFEQMLREYE